ncbi:hypothetical protein HPB50_026012 [Hyalomma asiaticum]|uniref:Uncharacterized protein n=1 Tax=Hyalomma asiaticum TaxID=266040 RepID=A0ACB7ST34_HYAAI|nr:hypothetical protein HPB50_026012 [Hyalomma asiaticum]
MLYDYAGLRMLLRWADSASEEFRNALLNLTNVDYTERWEKCVTEMNDKMPEITGYLYVQEKFSEEAKRESLGSCLRGRRYGVGQMQRDITFARKETLQPPAVYAFMQRPCKMLLFSVSGHAGHLAGLFGESGAAEETGDFRAYGGDRL